MENGVYIGGVFVSNSVDLHNVFDSIKYTKSDSYLNTKYCRSSEILYANIVPFIDPELDLYTNIGVIKSSQTEPLDYTSIVLATRGGVVFIDRLITKLPDIVASISGWGELQLLATVTGRPVIFEDITAAISIISQGSSNLGALLYSTYYSSIQSSLNAISPSDMSASVSSTPWVGLITSVVSVPWAGLSAFSGGHLPSFIEAFLQVIPPKDISGFIRPGYSSTLDLNADATASGGYVNIAGYLNPSYYSSSIFPASITVRGVKDLLSGISGWRNSNILASLVGFSYYDFRAGIVGGVLEATLDMDTEIRGARAGVSNVLGSLNGWISAHTSDKPYNYHLYTRPPKKVILATRGGLTIMSPEVIRGVFPDLHADIVSINLRRSELLAFIRPAVTAPLNITAFLSAVTSTVFVNKVVLDFRYYKNLSVYISAFSGYKNMPVSIKGKCSTSTSTASGSFWIYSLSIIRFYLGTDKGLYIPDSVVFNSVPREFINLSETPDLRSYLYGWGTYDFLASLTVQPYKSLPSYIYATNVSYMKQLLARIVSYTTSDIGSSISVSGGWAGINAELIVSGANSNLSAKIYPYVKALGYRIIKVHTKPFLNLRSVINPIAACGGGNTYSNLGAFIRGASFISTGYNMTAFINSSSESISILGSIIGKKATRLKLLKVFFRPKTRASEFILSSISGVKPLVNELGASITGDFHVSDMSASLTPYRHVFFLDNSFSRDIEVKSLVGGSDVFSKILSLSFLSKVDNYIYDSIEKSVYKIGVDKWVLNVEELTEIASFFDRDIKDRSRTIDNIVEYETLDEAIREAIRLLIEPSSYDLTASINPVGGYYSMNASVFVSTLDRVKDMFAKIFIVKGVPDLSATISAFSSYSNVLCNVSCYCSLFSEVSANINGYIYSSLAADVVCI